MNPARRIQTVNVSRTTRTINSTTGIESVAATSVLTAVRCRVRPLGPKQFDSVVGRHAQAVFAIEWGTEDIRVGDTVTYDSRAYAMQEVRTLTQPGALIKTQAGVLVELARKQTT